MNSIALAIGAVIYIIAYNTYDDQTPIEEIANVLVINMYIIGMFITDAIENKKEC